MSVNRACDGAIIGDDTLLMTPGDGSGKKLGHQQLKSETPESRRLDTFCLSRGGHKAFHRQTHRACQPPVGPVSGVLGRRRQLTRNVTKSANRMNTRPMKDREGINEQ